MSLVTSMQLNPMRCLRLLVFVLLSLGLEHVVFHKVIPIPESSHSVLARFYQQVVTATNRSTEPRFTAVVNFADEKGLSPSAMADRERFRLYLSEVLRHSALYSPRAVVLDFLFKKDGDSPGGARIQKVASLLCEELQIPVIFAEEIEYPSDRRAVTPAYGPAKQTPLCGKGAANTVSEDLRRVPLFLGSAEGPRPSLMLVAAEAVRPGLLEFFRAQDRNLDVERMAAFADVSQYRELPESEATGNKQGQPAPAYVILAADRLVGVQEALSKVAAAGEGKLPDLAEAKPELVRRLRGRILVFGSDGPTDKFDTVVGKVDGVLLQTGYLEAILDGRLLEKLGWPIQIGAALLFWFLVEYVGSVWTKLAIACVLVLAMLGCNMIAVAFWGRYGDFGAISLIGFFGLVMTEIHGRFLGGHHGESSGKDGTAVSRIIVPGGRTSSE